MDLGLAEQVVVVIGGAKGIGRAIGEAMADEQARVVLFDIDPQVEQVAQTLAARSAQEPLGLVADVTDPAALEQAATDVRQAFGGVDHLVFAAGAGSGKFGFPFWNLDPSDWRRVVEINLLGAVTAVHVFAPQLIERGGGSIQLLASVAGQMGSQTDPPYSAAKAGLINFGQCAAKDLAQYNVRVNMLSPGMVKTALNQSVWQAWHDQAEPAERKSYEAWAEEKIRTVSPLGRWQTPEDIAALSVFLASPKAHNITGQTLNVDGGQVMHS